jgi:DNA-binding MarR family transcriptional regulator
MGRNSDEVADRHRLENQLIEELTAFAPGGRGGPFKSWHRHALSLIHLQVLAILENEGPLSMSRLAEALDVADASATGIVDRMEKRGLVERRHDTDDRRLVLVHPTEAGEQVFTQIGEHRREMFSRVLAELADDELEALAKGMRAIGAARKRLFPHGPFAASSGPPAPAGGSGPAASTG